jgi:myosin heavy subunit
MENNKQKTVIYLGAMVIALLLIGMFFTLGSNKKNKRNLNNEKIASEKLLSEKLNREKELTNLQSDFSSLKQKSDANTKLLAETNVKIAEREKRINSLSGENRSLRAYRKELEDLKKAKADLEKESSRLQTDYEKLMAQNKDLQNSLSSVVTERNNLELQLENAKKVNPDNFLVTATRGKKAEKIVIKASRTKKLNMTFEVPQSLTEAIGFKIVTPSGTTINPDDKSITWFFPLDSRNYTASLSTVTGEFEQSRQVVLNYSPKGKLVKGEYKIQIISDNNNIGNCRIMLK